MDRLKSLVDNFGHDHNIFVRSRLLRTFSVVVVAACIGPIIEIPFTLEATQGQAGDFIVISIIVGLDLSRLVMLIVIEQLVLS